MVGVAAATGVVLTAVLGPAAVAGTHPADDFHALDGYVVDQSAGDPPYDWDDFFATPAGDDYASPTQKPGLPGNVISTDFTRDFLTNGATPPVYVNGDDSYFATGSKDTLQIHPGWQCKKVNNATDKGDFVNGYGYAANIDMNADPSVTDNHIIFFFGLEKDDDNGTNNLGFWLLQDENVACVSTGGNTDFAGSHVNGDLLATVSYASGGSVGTAQGFLWENGALNTTAAFTSNQADCTNAGVTPDSKFCITTNGSGTRSTPWWSPQKTDKTIDAVLQKNVFVEGFIDITNVFDDLNKPVPCFAKGLADTRASTSPTASLYDFLAIEAPTCGPLVIRKYFDRDADGSRDVDSDGIAPDTTDPYLSGWGYKVVKSGDDPTDPTKVLYSGTTAVPSGGTVAEYRIPDVPFGSYDVYETMKPGYYNTDPSGPTLMKSVTKGTGTDVLEFGNACFVDKTFTITGVPTGAALKVTYKINNGTAVDANMTADGTSRTYTLADTLKPTDVLDWSWSYQAGGPSGTIDVADDEVMSDYTDTSGVGTACAKANTDEFPYATLTGEKYKDKDADGTVDADDFGIGGFGFKLRTSTSEADSTNVVATATSSGNVGTEGDITFSNVAPGTYYVTEDAKTGWQRTLPAANNYIQVVVPLANNNSIDFGDFANAPLTDLQVVVDPQTNYSEGTISCVKGTDPTQDKVDGNGAADGTDVDGAAGATATWDKDGLLVGTYTCTVVITDP